MVDRGGRPRSRGLIWRVLSPSSSIPIAVFCSHRQLPAAGDRDQPRPRCWLQLGRFADDRAAARVIDLDRDTAVNCRLGMDLLALLVKEALGADPLEPDLRCWRVSGPTFRDLRPGRSTTPKNNGPGLTPVDAP